MLINIANKIPLYQLEQNEIFAANWNDAKRLDDKSSELYGRKTLNDDEKTMLAMDQYRRYKKFPMDCIPDVMRAFLSGYNNDISYMDPDKLTDEFVTKEYLGIMAEYEKLFQNTEKLHPGWKMDEEIDIDDL